MFKTRLRKASLQIIFIFTFIDINISSSYAEDFQQNRKIIRILSIDGGGIRGIIPALILKNITSRLDNDKHITDYFDIISGTSTGGIIALLLNTPDKNGQPRYDVSDVIELYNKLGNEVFQRTIWQKAKTGWGWWGARYSDDNLVSLLNQYFGEVELKDTIKTVIVPAYEIEMDKSFFFKSERAKIYPQHNYKLKDIARATSAAPTYFEPAQIYESSKQNNYVLIDGGVAANNPTLVATIYGLELYGRDTDFLIVSLGTGTNYGAKTKLIKRQDVQDSGLFGWAEKISSTIMYAVNDVTDYEMHYSFNHDQEKKSYYRFQPIIEAKHAELDNASKDNIKALYQYAEDYIKTNDQELQRVADVLKSS